MGKKGRLLAGAMLFASCTDNQSAVGSATVGGTLFGTAFSAMDAISGQNHDNGAVGISIVDFPGACALGANEKANAKVLNILPPSRGDGRRHLPRVDQSRRRVYGDRR